MRFDMHIHCGDQPIDPAKLLEQMDRCGIYGGVLFSHYPVGYKKNGWNAKDRMEQVLNVCREYPERLFPVLWIHPHEPDVMAVVEEAVARGIMGFKMICDNYYVSDPDSMALVRKIAENYRLPYYTLSPTYSVCREHGYLPGEQFICPHCGANFRDNK